MSDLPLDQIICGDNCDVLGTLPRECIDLVVTSPPYDDLRTYESGKPMSELWDFERLANELWRVIKPGGVVVWVVADATIDGSETGTSFRQALRFKEIGFNLHDTMIYRKSGGSPNIHHPRYVHCFEYMFVLSNGTPKAFHETKRKRNSTCGTVRAPATKTQRNGELKRFNVETKITSAESRDVNVWEYLVGSAGGDEGTGDHPAYFPEALARDHILSWSNEGDIVLDPFAGSCTTCKVARLMGRRWIGIEINPEYVEIGKNRMAQGVLEFSA